MIPFIATAQGLKGTDLQTYDPSSSISEDELLRSRVETFCLLKLLVEEPQKDRIYRNDLTGILDRTLLITNKKLVFSTDKIHDNCIPRKIGQHLFLLVMEKEGDAIKLDDHSKPIIGIGSTIRFDTAAWVPLFGGKYRKGGVKVTEGGLLFLKTTEREDEKGITEFNGQDWMTRSQK
jgi:hypothetical protein